MRRFQVSLVLPAALLLAGAVAVAAPRSGKLDAVMKQVLAEYLKVHRSLSSDSESGVAAASAAIDKLAAKLQGLANADPWKQLPAQLRTAAAKVKQARGLAAQREAFKTLSAPVVLWVREAKPDGIEVVHCSMANASWAQAGAQVRNPYYGSKMLTCGEVVSSTAKAK